MTIIVNDLNANLTIFLKTSLDMVAFICLTSLKKLKIHKNKVQIQFVIFFDIPGESDNKSAFELSVPVGDKRSDDDGLIFIDDEC